MRNVWLSVLVGLGLTPSMCLLSWAEEPVRSWPKDTTPYSRPVIADDVSGPLRGTDSVPGSNANVIGVIDAVVSNTDANLQNTDTFPDGETSIAVNPFNPDEIVMSAFSGSWGANAPIWHSTDGGQTWTKRFTVPAPPPLSGCPCDQAFDYGRNDVLYGTFLTTGGNIHTGSTTNPASAASWNWWLSGGAAQRTNLVATSANLADQPWILTNRGTTVGTDNVVYAAYDDFGTSPVNMRVSVSVNTVPPQFPAGSDKLVGSSGGAINPGHRMAKDPRNGWIYSLWQICPSGGTNCGLIAGNPKSIQYMLNRSIDRGVTWTLNASATGILVATANSTQPNPKFGTVNALLGGVLHAAVDPSTGDLYYVYGNRDGAGNNRLAIRRVFDNGAGGVTIGGENFVVSGTVQAAIPSVAVTDDGVVGVFYYTFNGFVSGFPQFSAWLAVSTDQGATFNSQLLVTFLSPATDDGITTNGVMRQRVLGDYMQMKSVDHCFYGSFTANGAAFGRSTSNMDPIFFKACVPASHPNRDFNMNGRADVLWRNNNGNVALWLLNGATVTSSAILGTVSNSWKIVSKHDFDGDGRSDILWRHSSGALALWFMNGSTVTGSVGLGVVANVWKIVATADFNADGRADILWRNMATGDVAIWFMNGGTVTSSVVLGAVSFDWTPERAADFNADGRADIQWRHHSGAVALWFMNGAVVTGSVGLGTVAPAWRIVRLGDFNGDGRVDILWRHANGTVAMWLMNGATVLSSAVLGVVATDWRIIGAGDFNGDGRADILWRNMASPPDWPLAIWFMNGATVSSSGGLGAISSAWSTN